MKRELLHRFFEGKTTVEEEKQLRSWLESSDENTRIYNAERMVHDALLLHDPVREKKEKKPARLSPWLIGTAATIALLIGLELFQLFNQYGAEEQYHTILVPAGQRINLLMADNTDVWLNANTTFRYPTQFSRKNRTVYLDGEAYFDVSKDKKKPFVVRTYSGDIEVTGTSFNVDAYSRFNTFETSLFEGGVDLYRNNTKLVSLKPNEKATIRNNQFVVSQINDSDAYLWRNGLIAFNDKPLKKILLSLEKYFDVTIQVDDNQLPENTYTGKFRQSDGVDYALRVLQRSIHFNYARDEETGTIFIK